MKLFDVLEIEELRRLCETFSALTGAAASFNNEDGTTLVDSGSHDTCTLCHLAYPQMACGGPGELWVRCGRLEPEERYAIRTCPHGLSVMAIPLFVGRQSGASILVGPFLQAPPDVAFFSRQAEDSGVEPAAFLASVRVLPVICAEKSEKMAEFLVQGARIIGELGAIGMLLEERKAHIRFLENLELVDWTIKQETDVDLMLSHIVKTVFAIFKCDRAWLFYPCDPASPTFRVPVEVTAPEYPGACELNVDLPLPPDMAENLREALASAGPVVCVAGTADPVNQVTAEQFGVRSQMFMAIYPRVGKPWVFGLHQCSHPRVWSREERRLFQEIGARLADGLSTQLMFRDLLQSEARYRRIVDTANEGVWVLGPDSRTAFVNARMAEMVGYPAEELAGRAITDFVSVEDLPDYHANTVNYRLEKAAHFECRFHKKNGQTVWAMASAVPILDAEGNFQGFFGMFTDITEKQMMEARLLHSQKLEAVGRLAGGVAHDFNNMLGVILGNTELALEEVSPNQTLFSLLMEIQKAATHSADLTRQLLAFARKQATSPKVLDLNATVAGMLRMLQKVIGEDVDLSWLPGKVAGAIRLDPSQLDQILVNLCINARDAIADGGRIAIRTGSWTVDDLFCDRRLDIHPGAYSWLSVSDTGSGMDQATQAKVFEPFFTTKGEGKGTGLGLSTVYGIVKQNGGFIELESAPGEGTTFQICLPVHDSSEIPEEGKSPEPISGGETVLLVEDEVPLLRIAKRLLVRLGYHVLAADGPEAALELAGGHTGAIDLLLTDVVMPGLNGLELRDRLLQTRPNVKCLLVSGYTADVIAGHKMTLEGTTFLQKPYSLQALSIKIREVLVGQDTSQPM